MYYDSSGLISSLEMRIQIARFASVYVYQTRR